MAFDADALAKLTMTDSPGYQDKPPAPDEVLHTTCPGPCDVDGPDVYRAPAHLIVCAWMMRTARRCIAHDELLRPDEPVCPTPWVPDSYNDPHDRQGRGDRRRSWFPTTT